MVTLFLFELAAYFRKVGFWFVALAFCGFGIFIGSRLSLSPGPNVLRDSPYSIANMIGFLSLVSIFIATPLAAKNLFREREAHFQLILYACPVSRIDYLASRFLGVFSISLICLLMLVLGFSIGQQIDPDHSAYGGFHLMYYLQPFLLLALPNLLFCTVWVCVTGWLTQNKLLVYISGLFLYIAYMVMLLFSGSPLMAGALPPSAEAMEWSARLDPFGLSAFYAQTNVWSVGQRNSELLHLGGNLLLNRVLYLLLSLGLLLVVWCLFDFSVSRKPKGNKTPKKQLIISSPSFRPIQPSTVGWRYQWRALLSFVSLDLKFVLKSIPFVLITIGLLFFMAMEIYTSIDQGIRIPEQYASTGLMVNRIVSNFQGMVLIVLLFYAHELLWRSQDSRFATIEGATPISNPISLLSKWISLSAVVVLFTTMMIALGLFFQWWFGYLTIDLFAYLSVYVLSSLPLVISTAMILSIQSLVKKKWPALLISAIVILLTATSIGKFTGIESPLLRFLSSFNGRYSEMNHWGAYWNSFCWKMLYGSCLTLLFFAVSTWGRNLNKGHILVGAILFAGGIVSGLHIHRNYNPKDQTAELNFQQQYEQQFGDFKHLPQPTITDIQTAVDLFPADNAYSVGGTYTIQNKTIHPIHKILLHFDRSFAMEKSVLTIGKNTYAANKHLSIIYLKKPMLPNETGTFQFSMRYQWNGFNGHESFNAIVQNGSFLRISNYYPRFGYVSDYEISDVFERRKRGLGEPDALLPLQAAKQKPDDFIRLRMTLSTAKNQTAIGIGRLEKQWMQNGRNYFVYQTTEPVPFRFGLSSAQYQVKKVRHRNKTIAVYYHPTHFENVAHLIRNARLTLDYCEKNFGPYPFDEIRFAEISSFTQGFAATAYPAVIFMPEQVIFHTNIKGDKQQDVINELAGHELSHQWWGANQLATEEREGSKFLTETLAMYTELMLAKQMYGKERLLENVRMHQDMYRNERGFTPEQPLYKTIPDNTFQHYSKGLITMYQLSELIGEDRVNRALKRFLTKYKYPNGYAVSTDLLREFYAEAETMHSKIDDLFKRITCYRFGNPNTHVSAIGLKFNTILQLKADKIYEDGKGNPTVARWNDQVEIALHFADGSQRIYKVPVVENQIDVSFSTPSKPITITIDPNELWIKTTSTNHYGIE